MIENTKSSGLHEVKTPSKASRIISFALLFYLRLLGMVILGVGILLWSSVLGLHGADIQQLFNTNEFQAVMLVILAVMLPLLGVGLWLAIGWGRVLGILLGSGLIGLYVAGQPVAYALVIFANALIFLILLHYLLQSIYLRTIGRIEYKAPEVIGD